MKIRFSDWIDASPKIYIPEPSSPLSSSALCVGYKQLCKYVENKMTDFDHIVLAYVNGLSSEALFENEELKHKFLVSYRYLYAFYKYECRKEFTHYEKYVWK